MVKTLDVEKRFNEGNCQHIFRSDAVFVLPNVNIVDVVSPCLYSL